MGSICYYSIHSLLCFRLLIQNAKFKIYLKQICTFEINMKHAYH
jgi:hypothetical protein